MLSQKPTNKMSQQATRELERVQAASDLTVEGMLQHIYYYRIHDYVEQIALLNTLPAFLREHPEVTQPSFASTVHRSLIHLGSACGH